MTLAALLLAGALVDMKPGLLWQDPLNLLPSRVADVPTDSLRIGKNFMGEYFGAWSASAERMIFAVAPGHRTSTISPTTDLYFYGFEGGMLASASNRIVSTRRLSSPDVATAAFNVLRQFFSYSQNHLATTREETPESLPTFNWSAVPWSEISPTDWAEKVKPFCGARTNGVLKTEESDNAVLSEIFDLFVTTNGWASTPLRDAVEYTGGCTRPPSPDELLDSVLSQAFPSPPTPTAADIARQTFRIDRAKLTAIDYAAALADRNWAAIPGPHFDELDAYYEQTSAATATVQTTWTYKAETQEIEFDMSSVNWHSITSSTVVTNSLWGSSEANVWTSGSSSTNASWSLLFEGDIRVECAAIEGTLLGLDIPREPDPTNYVTVVTAYNVGGEISVELGPTWAYYANGDEEFDGVAYELQFLTPAKISLWAGAARGARLKFPVVVHDPYESGCPFAGQWEDGIIQSETVWNICSRWDETDESAKTYEYKISSGSEATSTNAEAILVRRAANSAIDEAVELAMRRTGGVDIRNIESYLGVASSVVDDAKARAAAVKSVGGPPSGMLQSVAVSYDPGASRVYVGGIAFKMDEDFSLIVIPGVVGDTYGAQSPMPAAKVGAAFRPYALQRLKFWNCRQK